MSPAVYVAQWPEDKILRYFWLMVREDADRLELLGQLAAVAVRRQDDWSPEAVREEHDAKKHYASKASDRCFCCRTGDRRLYWHHIVAIQHGGSNDRDNLVAICLRCHGTVHPWLDVSKPDKRQRRTGWTSMRSLTLEEFGKVLRVANGNDER